MPKDTENALVRKQGSRSLVAITTAPVRMQLARISDAIPQPVKQISRKSAKVCGASMAVVTVIVLVFIAGAYARLMRGPISFAFLVPSLQEQLNAQSQGYQFKIGDAILRLSDNWGLEFRLANVSLLDDEGQELAKAPFAAIDMSERSLAKFSLAPSAINLLGPKVLVFNSPGKGLTFTASGDDATFDPAKPNLGQNSLREDFRAQSSRLVRPGTAAAETEPTSAFQDFNPAPLFARLFAMIDKRRGASSALSRIGLTNATVYFVGEKGLSTWNVADLHIDMQDSGKRSDISGELTLRHGEKLWRLAFEAANRPRDKRYSVIASAEDIIPRAIWESVPAAEALKNIDLPVTAAIRFDIGHDGTLLNGQVDVNLKAGQFKAPWDEKHPATIDGGLFKASYDGKKKLVTIDSLELTWEGSRLNLEGSIANADAGASSSWVMDIDGRKTSLSAPQFGIPPYGLDVFRIVATYTPSTDSIVLNGLNIKSGEADINISGKATSVSTGGPVSVRGKFASIPLPFLKLLWPTFVAHGARDWIGTNVPAGRIVGGDLRVDLSAAAIAELEKGGDVPDDAVSLKLNMSGLEIYSIIGLPPIETKETIAQIIGRRFIFDIPSDGTVTMPSGKKIAFTEGQFAVSDLRPRFPTGEIRFKGSGEAVAVMELLDQPPLGYVRAVGFKPDLINGKSTASFAITLPLLKELKFAQMGLVGKARVSDLRSNALPGGLVINGGAVNFDISASAIGANGDLKLNGVPVSLAWQRIFDAPPERQPTLRVAGVLSEKARDDLGMNVNHIVRGDLPIAVAVSMQRDGPPKLFAEAALTNADIFLTAIGWRKPPGQKAMLNFDISQRQDGFVVLDNFAMTGDGLNINGRLVMNDKRRIAAFSFPEFSTNALTQLAISGELNSQNVLKVQAKGPSFDGRQFFRSLFSAGKIADNQPAPIKDEPGLDLSVEIDTIFGFHDATIKSVKIDGKRRGGKLTSLEIAGRLNGEAPVAVRMDQKPGESRLLVTEATDAGSVFRIAGFYRAMRGGQMTLRVNLDGTGVNEKSGILYVQNFQIVGDQVLGNVVSKAEQENARRKPGTRGQASGDAPLLFDRLYVPFSVGANQFTLRDSSINGPVLGATARGRIDYARDTISISGTYVPLYGLNSMFGPVPILGELFNSRKGEGLFGITYTVQGRTSNPDVQVNPVSVLAPGFLRQIFEFDDVSAAPQPERQQSAPSPAPRKPAAPLTRPGPRASSPSSTNQN